MVAIAQIVESFAYGTAKSVVQLCEMLSPDDRVSVYYGKRQGTELDLQGISDKVQWCPLPGAGPAKHLTNLRYLNQALKGKYDVVHGHSSYGGLYAKLIGPRHGLQTLYSPRGFSFLREDFSATGRKLFRFAEKLTAKRCLTVCCGPYEQTLAQALGGDSVRINNGFVVSEPLPVEQLKQSVLGVGRICPQKGFDIFAEVARKSPAVPFTWVGDVQKGDTATENLPENLRLISYMPHRELLEQVRTCRFVFLPSRWEGLSRFLIESVCLGKAIVTSRFPGNLDCLDGDSSADTFSNGVACRTIQQYVDTVEWLAQDDPALGAMQTASYRFAQHHFDIDKIMLQWQSLYRSFAPEC